MEERNDRSASTTRRCLLAIFCGRTSLLVLMTGYALLGAILFETIEGGEEHDVPHDFQKSREECLKELWLITERLNVLYEKNWTKLVTEQLKRFEKTVVESGKADGIVNSSRPHWTFGGALLYSVTLLTTVGYGKLSPKTALGKVAAIIYAIIGVPLMLILLSALGSLLASGARKCYSKLCCQNQSARIKSPSVGYHKAPTSPGKHCSKTHDDTTTIQLSSQAIPNHVNCSNHLHQQQQQQHYPEQQEVPKRAVLATVRTNRTRSWCRQMPPVRQTLADPQVPQPCPAHSHGTPVKASMNSTIVGISTSSDLDDAEDTDDNEHVCSHDTPSRVPLIWRCPEDPSSSPKRRGRRGRAGGGAATSSSTAAHPQDLPPSVPALLVLTIFVSYVCAGAVAFSSTSGWSFLDAVYFCFVTLSTIGVGDRLPQGDELDVQLQLYAYCLYLIVGLVIVSMCFSLVQEEVAVRCRQFANSVGLMRH